jgi:hypothetical protein
MVEVEVVVVVVVVVGRRLGGSVGVLRHEY